MFEDQLPPQQGAIIFPVFTIVFDRKKYPTHRSQRVTFGINPHIQKVLGTHCCKWCSMAIFQQLRWWKSYFLTYAYICCIQMHSNGDLIMAENERKESPTKNKDILRFKRAVVKIHVAAKKIHQSTTQWCSSTHFESFGWKLETTCRFVDDDAVATTSQPVGTVKKSTINHGGTELPGGKKILEATTRQFFVPFSGWLSDPEIKGFLGIKRSRLGHHLVVPTLSTLHPIVTPRK